MVSILLDVIRGYGKTRFQKYVALVQYSNDICETIKKAAHTLFVTFWDEHFWDGHFWDEHFWDEPFIGVSLTSSVGRKPTERVKLTLGHPAHQAI